MAEDAEWVKWTPERIRDFWENIAKNGIGILKPSVRIIEDQHLASSRRGGHTNPSRGGTRRRRRP